MQICSLYLISYGAEGCFSSVKNWDKGIKSETQNFQLTQTSLQFAVGYLKKRGPKCAALGDKVFFI